MGRGKGPTGRTAKFERRPRATLRMGEPKVDASSSDGSHASDTADRGTEQLGVIFSKAPEPARGRSKRETASATVPAGLRKGEVVLALPFTNVRARHAQHTGLGYVHADGGRSSQHVVTGRWAISFVGRSCVRGVGVSPSASCGRAASCSAPRTLRSLVSAMIFIASENMSKDAITSNFRLIQKIKFPLFDCFGIKLKIAFAYYFML